jgi:cytidyltransferase-like protein
MKKIMVFGTFDILHPGHIHMLEEAKSYGDYLVVVIARDKTVTKVKQRKPRNTEQVRLKNIENLHIADKVLLGSLKNKFEAIQKEQPSVIALGYDQKIPVTNLSERVGGSTTIIRLSAYKPDIYKSSKLSHPILLE